MRRSSAKLISVHELWELPGWRMSTKVVRTSCPRQLATRLPTCHSAAPASSEKNLVRGICSLQPLTDHSALLSSAVPLPCPLRWAHFPPEQFQSFLRSVCLAFYFTGRYLKMPVKWFNIFCYIMKIYSPPLSQIILRVRINCLGNKYLCILFLTSASLQMVKENSAPTWQKKVELKNKLHCMKIPRINIHRQNLGKGPSPLIFCNEIPQVIKRTNI